jgi:hypothetical protein
MWHGLTGHLVGSLAALTTHRSVGLGRSSRPVQLCPPAVAIFQPSRPVPVAGYGLGSRFGSSQYLSKAPLLALPRMPVLLIIPEPERAIGGSGFTSVRRRPHQLHAPDLGGYALDGTSQVCDVHMQALPSRMR